DACYVFGACANDPELCDLAIEVVWTLGTVRKLEVYRRLRVREVWMWRAGRISVQTLSGAAYVEIERSEFVPELDLAQLLTFVAQSPLPVQAWPTMHVAPHVPPQSMSLSFPS